MIQRPKGTKDILPEEIGLWQYIEKVAKDIMQNYGFSEIRVPVFEHTELFQRGVGGTTDVVQKEMYTFNDKGERSITLRPEGTAGIIRAYIENGMASMPTPVRLWYNMAMYRYENVQKGRLREFHQIGAELIGTSSFEADVETICMAKRMIDRLELNTVKLNLNSIGCKSCRAEYQEALKNWIKPNLSKYCETCQSRYEKNPMRILDCKERTCKELNHGAPKILDYLCEECKMHFENVKKMLNALEIDYKIDSDIVRGLDYYTKTVFEFVDEQTGLTVLGGGRYDNLVEELDGGVPTPAIGFAMGVERIADMISKQKQIEQKKPKLYIAQIGEEANIFATKLVEELRNKNVYVVKDVTGKSLKAQFKYADRICAKYVITIGETEINEKMVILKNMVTGEQMQVALNADDIVNKI